MKAYRNYPGVQKIDSKAPKPGDNLPIAVPRYPNGAPMLGVQLDLFGDNQPETKKARTKKAQASDFPD